MEETTKTLSAQTEEKSYFDGGFFAYFGLKLLVRFLTVISLGIAYPWLCCMLHRWKASHTVVCGKRMYFDGKGGQLIGKYLLWCLLTWVTFGIYGFWLSLSVKKWVARHTHFEGEEDDNSYFDGNIWGFIGTKLLSNLAFLVPVVGPAWRSIIRLRWFKRHTVVDSRRLFLDASMGNLFGKYLLWGFLTVITLGIFGFFLPVKTMRWEIEHTIDHEHTTQALIRRSEYRANIHTDATAFKTYQVENDMEFVKSGITATTDPNALLALANQGSRVAQYEYVKRYADGKFTEEPFTSFLKTSAWSGYAPAMDLYLQTHEIEPSIRDDMLHKAAEHGQIRSVKERMMLYARDGVSRKEDKDALPSLYEAIRYADILQDYGQSLTEEESALIKKCILTARRIEAKYAYVSKGGKAAAIVAIVIAVPIVLTLLIGGLSMISQKVLKVNPFVGRQSFGTVEMTGNSQYTTTETINAQDFQSGCLDTISREHSFQIVAVADGFDDNGLGMTVYEVTSDGANARFELRTTRDSGNLHTLNITGDRTLSGGEQEGNQAQIVFFTQQILDYMIQSDSIPEVSTADSDGMTVFGDWQLLTENTETQMVVSIVKN